MSFRSLIVQIVMGFEFSLSGIRAGEISAGRMKSFGK